ncbi:cytochrome c biogenesis protein CcdA [Candidatus Woesebacteria bacterium]|nr:cytochrome c biogenesis protein CcdA [Candidatus Woesebacteria bacterium]QQG47891.1 MAG: cytochrome c biogenesis protein CcdA [Candidatus Woesebacteria bacterium]
MNTNFLFGISLTASFLAGVLALFAPCCITFLFPSYLGTIFKENKKVMLYTLIFALGLGSVLVPIALGVRFAIFFLDSYHTQVYYLGAIVMILMGVMTLKPIFHLPQIFHMSHTPNKKVDAASVFGLGLMSGLTSACCAPVLFAAVTLTSLSPTLFQAIIVSFAYVMGIVMPLFVISMFYEKATSKIGGVNRQKIYKVLKFVGAGIFFLTGFLIAVFNYQGKLKMGQMEGYSTKIRLIVFEIAKYFKNPILDLLVFGIIVFIFYKLLHYKGHEKK